MIFSTVCLVLCLTSSNLTLHSFTICFLDEHFLFYNLEFISRLFAASRFGAYGYDGCLSRRCIRKTLQVIYIYQLLVTWRKTLADFRALDILECTDMRKKLYNIFLIGKIEVSHWLFSSEF